MSLVQLCEKWDGSVEIPGSWLMSEKLDGMRAFWDGGVTRGMLKSQVPWAYCKKDARLRTIPRATGLWSRYGGVIQAPDWWLDRLPNIMLDGELYDGPSQGPGILGQAEGKAPDSGSRADYGFRQDLLSIVKGGGDWSTVGYRVYDAPPPSVMMEPRTMRVGKDKVGICYGEFAREVAKRPGPGAGAGFQDRMEYIPLELRHPQIVIMDQLAVALNNVLSAGGEGLVVRHPQGLYKCKRHAGILKIKGMDEDEGSVVGTTDGLGRHSGRIGALQVRWKDRVIVLGSGLTDQEREMSDWVGQVVTFRYRGVSKDGWPQEPRFIRRRDYES